MKLNEVREAIRLEALVRDGDTALFLRFAYDILGEALERFLLIPKDAPSIQLTNGPSNEWRVPAGVYYFGGPTP